MQVNANIAYSCNNLDLGWQHWLLYSGGLFHLVALTLLKYCFLLGAPSSGLYFMYNGSIYYNKESLKIFLVGSLPTDRSDPGSTLV